MSWRYGCKKFDMGDDHYEYGLVEVYNMEGEYYHTENPVDVFAESPIQLAEWLRRAADDIDKHGEVKDET